MSCVLCVGMLCVVSVGGMLCVLCVGGGHVVCHMCVGGGAHWVLYICLWGGAVCVLCVSVWGHVYVSAVTHGGQKRAAN